MKEVFPEPELELHPLPRPRRLAVEVQARPEHPPALGDRARLPDRGDLLARRPVVLLEPARERAGEPPGPLGHRAGGRTSSTTSPAASCPPTSSPSATSTDFKEDRPKPGALRIAKLRHAGDWNIAPLAIPNLTTTLRDKLKFDVVINHKELFARDPEPGPLPLDLPPRPDGGRLLRGGPDRPPPPPVPRRRDPLRRRRLREPRVRRLVPPLRRRPDARPPPGPDPQGRRLLHPEARLRPVRRPV